MFHILIDTEVFRRENLHFTSRRFHRLAELVREGHITVYVTDVTVGEIGRAIDTAVADAVALLKRKETRRILGILAQSDTERFSGVLSLNKEALVQDLSARFDRLLSDLKTVTISSDSIAISEVRRRYFEASPPFSTKSAKKHEFPDALSVLAAEKHAKALGSTLYVVSADQGVAAASDSASDLAHFDSLAAVISYILESVGSTAKITVAAEKAATVLKNSIMARVRDIFANSGFYVDEQSYGDVDEVTVQEIDLGELTVAEVHGTIATLEFWAAIQFTADIIIDDPERSVYDNENGYNYVFGQLERSVDTTIYDVEGTIELEVDTADPGNATILSVALFPGDFGVKFPWP